MLDNFMQAAVDFGNLEPRSEDVQGGIDTENWDTSGDLQDIDLCTSSGREGVPRMVECTTQS